MTQKRKAEANGITPGRIVHFVTRGRHNAAVITHVWDAEAGRVNLYVFLDGSFPLPGNTPTSVDHDETGTKEYTWHWIEQA